MAEKPVVTCPNCDKKFKAKADVRGKKILCPFCDQSFVVGAEVAAPGKVKGRGADPDPIPLADDGDTIPMEKDVRAKPPPAEEEEPDDDNPYGVTHLDSDPRCPNCTEKMVPKNAVVCLACGYNTLTREWGKTEKTIGVSFGRQFVYLLPGFLQAFLLLAYIILQLIFACSWPYWVAGRDWISWTDYEGWRMWSTTLGMGIVFVLGRFCYIRFIVKPLPDELEIEEART